MTKTLSLVALIVIYAGAVSGFAQILRVGNAGFGNVPVICDRDFAYQAVPGGSCDGASPEQAFNIAPAIDWVFGTEGAGIAGGNAIYLEPPPFAGLPFAQAAFLQGSPSYVLQAVPGFESGGLYRISFYLGSRYPQGAGYDGNQTLALEVDGRVVRVFPLVSYTPFTPQSAYFTSATSGTHVLKFVGLNMGDHTAFFSGVSVVRVR